jgi:23S rRNA (adenine2503-C2)-methyltransferase
MGIPEGIRRLADMELQINLAISLHAADESKRGLLIPLAKNIPLRHLLEAAEYYRHRTTRDVTYEVLLLKGVNDDIEDAEKMAALLKGKKCAINLIAYNPVKGLDYLPPDSERISAFRKTIEKARIPVTVRNSKGTDINAACGQLRLNPMEGA